MAFHTERDDIKGRYAQTVKYPSLRVESSKYKYERELVPAVLPSASRKEAEDRRRSPASCRAIYSMSGQ